MDDFWKLLGTLISGVLIFGAYTAPMVIVCTHLTQSGQHVLAWTVFGLWGLLLMVLVAAIATLLLKQQGDRRG